MRANPVGVVAEGLGLYIVLVAATKQMNIVPTPSHTGDLTMRRAFRTTLVALALVGAVASTVHAQQPAKRSLYDRLGGKAAITAVVNEFVSRVAADTRINSFFAATAADTARLASFKAKLVDQICQATGGQCHYMGKDMKAAHAGMGITHENFVALVEDLSGALDKFNVPKAEKDELLGALGPMEKDIVGS